MFFITFSTLWSFSYFFIYIYTIVIFSIIIYIIPSIKDIINYNKFKKNNIFEYLTGFDLYWLLMSPLLILILINFSWCSYSLSSWFGNILFSSFQYKINYLIFFFFFYYFKYLFQFFLFFFKRNIRLYYNLF